MKVVLVEPQEKPVVKEISSGLASMQELVGGYIQAIYPLDDPEITLICNDEGKLNGLPLNRALRDSSGRIYDVVAGTFFLCAAPSDSERFEGLSDEQAKSCMKVFEKPEMFVRINGTLTVFACP